MKTAALALALFTMACGPLPTEDDDMGRSSIFRNVNARPTMQGQPGAQSAIEVNDENQLLAALTSLPRSDEACYGKSIVLTADVIISATIILGNQHAGLTFAGAGRPRFVALDATVGTLFEVGGTAVDDVSVMDVGVSGFTAFLSVPTDTASRWTVINVTDSAQTAGITTAGGVLAFATILGSALGPITADMNGSRISTSTFPSMAMQATVGATISANFIVGGDLTVNASGGQLAITGNKFASGSIDTSAGIGENTIVGNVTVVLITSHATDAVGLNT